MKELSFPNNFRFPSAEDVMLNMTHCLENMSLELAPSNVSVGMNSRKKY